MPGKLAETLTHSFASHGILASLFGSDRAQVGEFRSAQRRMFDQPIESAFGIGVVRREALRHIPGIAGMDWRDVRGSDGLPGAERLRGKEHARKPVAGSRYQGRCAGRPARYGES